MSLIEPDRQEVAELRLDQGLGAYEARRALQWQDLKMRANNPFLAEDATRELIADLLDFIRPPGA